MEIINKTKDKMKGYPLHTQNGESWYFSQVDIEGLNLMLITDLDGEDKGSLLAVVQWVHGMDKIAENRFENSVDGFNEACEWLDDIRLEISKKLL